MTGQRKPLGGGNREGAKVISLTSYHKPQRQKPQVPYAEKIAEDAWLNAKREYLENPSQSNFWAMGILERAFFLMYGKGGPA